MSIITGEMFQNSPSSLPAGQAGVGGKRILFIDRDGTLIKEAPPSYQIDSWEKLEFYPDVFKYMSKIADELDYVLIMVSNQDGLGTPSFPAESFWPIHQHVIKSFENEGVSFHATHIDKSFPGENSPNRKPGIGMFTEYLIRRLMIFRIHLLSGIASPMYSSQRI